jgi:hypothetical protein
MRSELKQYAKAGHDDDLDELVRPGAAADLRRLI